MPLFLNNKSNRNAYKITLIQLHWPAFTEMKLKSCRDSNPDLARAVNAMTTATRRPDTNQFLFRYTATTATALTYATCEAIDTGRTKSEYILPNLGD
jgi:hypothetical protein